MGESRSNIPFLPEESFRMLAEHSPNMIFINYKGKIVFVNRKFMEIMGYSKDEFYSPEFDFLSLISDEYKEVVRINYNKYLNGEVGPPNEYKLVKKSGETIDTIISTELIQYEDGKAILGIVTDISEIKRYEREVMENEQKFRSLVESTNDWIWEVDEKVKYTYVSPQVSDILGYEPEEIIGKTPFELMPDQEARRIRKEFYSFLRGRISFKNMENINLHKDGHPVFLETSGVPFFDKEGRFSGYRGIDRDISFRKLSEKALRESEENFRTLAENSKDAIFLTSHDGSLQYVNRRAAEITGYSVAELLRLKIENITSPDEYKKVVARFNRRIKGEFAPFQYEAKLIRKDGAIIQVEITAATTVWHAHWAGVIYVRDITQRKKFEKKLMAYHDQLKTLTSKLTLAEEHERRKIATEIHDRLGQSLAISKIKLSELQNSIASGPAKESIQEIKEFIEKMIEETRSLTFELSPPILYELGFTPAVEWLAEQFQKRHDLSITIRDGSGNQVMNDDIRFVLFGTVRELLVNIVKHARAKNVNIAISQKNGFLRISVEDDGIGFDLSGAKSNSPNSGFGLFQIRERLKYMKGNIHVDSSLHRGTKIMVRVPLH